MKDRISWTSVMGALVVMSAGAAHAEYHSASPRRLRLVARDGAGGVPLGPHRLTVPRSRGEHWPVDLRVTCERPARGGNLLVLFHDLADEQARGQREMIAIYQGLSPAS